MIHVGILRESGMGKEVDAALKRKVIWPFPSSVDGKDSGHVERMAICKEAKFQLWQSKKKEEKGATWNLLNGTVLLYLIRIQFRFGLGSVDCKCL